MNTININNIIDKYQTIVKRLNIKNFNLYELEFLLFYRNINFQVVKNDKNIFYLSGNNLNLLYNNLSEYGFYCVDLVMKSKNVIVTLKQFTVEILQKRVKCFRMILSEMFNKDLSLINKVINDKKRNLKYMSDLEISCYKKDIDHVSKIKKEFVNIIKKLSV